MIRVAREVAADRLRRMALQHGEFVAAEPRDRIGCPDAAAQAFRDDLQHGISDVMPERIVDLLEPVEIKADHGQNFAAPDALEGLLQTLPQQAAIGQVGERIMARHVRDLPFVLVPLREIADGVDFVAAHLARKGWQTISTGMCCRRRP